MLKYKARPGCTWATILILMVLAYVVPGQSILREMWLGIDGTIDDFTSHPDYPSKPFERTYPTLFEGPVNVADSYGTRFRGYVIPPASGPYTFWVASDNSSRLFLSTNELPENKRLIAQVLNYTGSREWTKETNQQSAPIPLVSGQRYYVEVLQVEGAGGDNVAVGWRMPTGVEERPITGQYLVPWTVSSNPPAISSQPASRFVQEYSDVAFTTGAVGDEPMRYQWLRDGAPIDGETTATLMLYRVTLEDSGTLYQCVVTNLYGAATSQVASLYVMPDLTPPALAQTHPAAGSTVRSLGRMEVYFTEPVQGVAAADLLINGAPATQVTGLGSGPYLFTFPPASAEQVICSWAANQNIRDISIASNRFTGASWSVTLNPLLPVDRIVINEFLASNENGRLDEDGEPQDWIELLNDGTNTVDLAGWTLTDDPDQPEQWPLPPRNLSPGEFLVIFASGKDRRSTAGTNWLHANFKLAGSGEYLALFNADSPRQPASEFAPEFPEQRQDFSYGRDAQGQWQYYWQASPGAPNHGLTATGMVSAPVFSAGRGFYGAPFNLQLACETPGAAIIYTTDGSAPTAYNGNSYTGKLLVQQTRMIRAIALKPGSLPSRVITHTYLLNQAPAIASLPALSLVTAENHLTGPTGIIGIGGGTYVNGVWQSTSSADYFNPTNQGIAWERPVSAEFIRPADNSGFQTDCGLRVQGSPHIRPRYTVTSKFSYRLYFRGDYGDGRLNYPLFGDSPVQSFNQIVIRAGKNDLSNPFIKDELVRRLAIDMGQVHVRGTFVNLFVNGVYKGYYNPTERNEEGFFQEWFGGQDWDVITVNREALDGDNLDFNAMRTFISGNNMTNQANYAAAAQWLDLTNFVDYLTVNLYPAMRDWPHNNWRAARERRAGALWRFFIWDAEGAFGTFSQPVTESTFTNGLNNGTSEIPRIYQALMKNPEFRLLFADRVQKHFFNGGALMDANVVAHFTRMQTELLGVIPSMITNILTTWVPQRRPLVLADFANYDLAAFTNAPVFNQHGGRVPQNFSFTMSTGAGTIYYTTNGTDPRVPFSEAVAPDAQAFAGPIPLNQSLPLRARSLHNGKWSALTAADFQVGALGVALRISEIMCAPMGGGAFEFVELFNAGNAPIDLSHMTFSGIDFKFLPGTWLAAGQRLVLASSQSPPDFAVRYPGVTVAGWFNGSLRNEGERLELRDSIGRLIECVTYDIKNGWPTASSSGGRSLELIDPAGDPDSPASWQPSAAPNGSPGTAPSATASPVRLNELAADNGGRVMNGTNFSDWIELHNPGNLPVSLAGWQLSDAKTNLFLFPEGAVIGPKEFLTVWMDQANADPGLHAGFALDREGETLFLADSNAVRMDAIAFGAQLSGYSLGRGLDDQWRLCQPTPSAINQSAATTAATNLCLNEWLANALPGQDDWVELFNRHTNLPVALHGIYVGTSNDLHQIRSHAFLAPQGFIQMRADENPGPDHLNFKLPASSGAVLLHDDSGFPVMKVLYSAQPENVSRGSLPDGSANFTNFAASQSPGFANYLTVSTGLQINEVMARNLSYRTNQAGNIADWVELYNTNSQPVSLAGMSVCLNAPGRNRWYFPEGAVIGPTNYLVLWCDPLAAPSTNAAAFLNTGHALESEGGAVYLHRADGRITDAVEFGYLPPNRTLGRTGAAWKLLAAPTPAAPNASAATLALPANLRLNEWLANSQPGQPDYVELYNLAGQPVELSGLGLTDDPSIAGQFQFTFPPLSFIAPTGFVQVIADGQPGQGRNHAAFAIAELGETLRLYHTNAVILDSVDTALALPGYAEARCSDGGPQVCFTSTLTPGAANIIFFPLTIFKQPASLTVTNGSSFSFAVSAQGTGSLRYQWYQNELGLTNGTNAVLSVSNAAAQHPGRYWVRVTDDLTSLNSEPADLTVLFRPVITVQPSNWLVLAGSNVTFALTATGTGPLTYRWRRAGTVMATNVDLPTLTLTNVQASNATFYSAIVANPASGGVGSRTFFLSVVTNYPISQILAPGAAALLRVGTASALPITHQWQFNGEPLPGQTNASLALTNFDAAQVGAYTAVLTMTNLPLPLVTPPAWLHLPRPVILAEVAAAKEPGLSVKLDAYEGLRYAVETSGDLLRWDEILTFTHTNGTLVLPPAPNAPQSFYRLRLISP